MIVRPETMLIRRPTCLAILSVITAAGCSLPHSGERGGFETYAVRFSVADEETGRKLSGVGIEVRDGLRSTAAVGRTNTYGEYTFRKQYGRTRAMALGSRTGYPTKFTVVFELEGYKRLMLTVPERDYRFGLDAEMSVSRKDVTLQRGKGAVVVDER